MSTQQLCTLNLKTTQGGILKLTKTQREKEEKKTHQMYHSQNYPISTHLMLCWNLFQTVGTRYEKEH